MSKLSVCFALLLVAICCMSFVSAAPAAHILDWQTAIQKIIAEYEKFPGPSIHHPPEVAHLIDPNHFTVHL